MRRHCRRILSAGLAALMGLTAPLQTLARAEAPKQAGAATVEHGARAQAPGPDASAPAGEPRSQVAGQDAEMQRRRAQGLEELRRFSGAAAQEARAAQAKREAEAIVGREEARLQRALAKGATLGLSEAELQAEAVKVSPGLGAALAGQRGTVERPRAKEAFAPDKARRSLRPKLPKPRRSPPSERGELTPELQALYASVAGERAYVEQADGSLWPVEMALAGVRPRPVLLASATPALGTMLPLLAALPGPTAADLAQTPETRRSPELLQLVAALGNRPVALFNYVRTGIRDDLYYGSKRGAAATLAEGAGNDFDQASLLVALLRAAGIPARYEYGIVELSKEQALALSGAADVPNAYAMLSKVAPVALATWPDCRVCSPDSPTLQMERAWVRAYVGYGDYRGTGPGGDKLWVRLDPGLKRVEHGAAVDLKGLVPFDFDAYLSGLTGDSPLDAFEAQLLAAARARNLCNTLDDAVSKAVVTQDVFRLLPADHPAKVVQSLLVFARPPETFRHEVTVTLDDESTQLELAALQGRSLTLEYPGATAGDEAVIQGAGGIENIQPTRVLVEPRLYADGQLLARFTPLHPGIRQRLVVQVTVPEGDPAVGVNRPVSGATYALLINGGTVAAATVDALREATHGLSGVALLRAQALLALYWWAREDEESGRRLYALQGHAAFSDVKVGLAGREYEAQFRFGLPISLSRGHYVIDISRNALTPLPKDGDDSLVPALLRLAGHQGSFLEAKVWEETLSTAAISSVRIIQAARSQPVPVPVYVLTKANPQDRAKLSGYDQSTLTDVDQAIAAGWRVTIPEHPLSYLDFDNVEGYILENPVDGSALYRIGSTLNGGATPGGNPSGGPEPNCPCPDLQPGGSTVDMARGEWMETWTDLTLPAVGLPVVWSRTYSSRATGLTELGYGWMHSFGMHLRAEPNGDVTYVTEDWRVVRFAKGATGFTPPPGWHMTLAATASGHRLRMKDGPTYDFGPDGKLVSVAEPSGNRVDLVYAGGLLSQVMDSDRRVALTVTHVGNKIATVTDRAGRTVKYEHARDDLVLATDVLNQDEAYAYDRAHNLVRRTDKRGQAWLNFYDFQDRWVGSRDPLGQEASAAYDFVNHRSVYIDRTGAAWRREHNDAGNQLALVDPLGNRVDRTWDTQHNPLTERDSRGLLTTMTYDGQGNLLSRTQPDARQLLWTYEPAFSRVTRQTATGLPSVTMTYDAAGRVMTRTDGLGPTTYSYDGRGQVATVTAPGTATRTFAYDAFGNIRTITDATGRLEALGYDVAGHPTSITDGAGKTRTLEVDAAGQVTAMVDAAGARTEFAYDAVGHRTSVKDAAGHVTLFGYDLAGRLVKEEDALGRVTTTAYDAEGRVVAVTDARGFVTETRYDAAGRVAETEAADGAMTTRAYCADVPTAPCAVVDALGNLTTTDFDTAGRVTTVTDAVGRKMSHTYDSGGRLRTQSGPTQVTTTHTYGASGLPQTVSTPALAVTYGYDGRGNRTSVTANGQLTTFTYDTANRLLTETNPLGKVTSFTYDAAGDRQTKMDGNGQVTTYRRDGTRRLTEVQFADGTTYQYAYDARGNRTLEQSPSHARRLTYDALDRVKTVEDLTLGRVLEYAYDEAGNRTSVKEGDLLHNYAYDALGRLKKATGPGGSVFFDYDALGRRTLVSRPNGVVTTYRYDAAGQVVDIVHAKDGAVLARFGYAYDHEGMRVAKTYADGTREAYGYDAEDRLTTVQYGTTRKVVYSLDSLGNRTQLVEFGPTGVRTKVVTSTVNAFNQLTSASQQVPSPSLTTTYAYDDNGNLLSEITGAAVKQYAWDRDNRLREVTLPSGAVSTYEYDANGLRTKKVEVGAETRSLLDGPNVLEELDASGARTTSYLTHPGVIDEILSFTTDGQPYWPLTDALGSIYAVTDATGAVVRINNYDVFGRRTSSSGTGPSVSYGYTGREHDVSGLNYHRDRYRDPFTDGWLQSDRLGMAAGPNAYLYALARPTQGRDWSGKKIDKEHSDPVVLMVAQAAMATRIGHRFVWYLEISPVPVVFEGPPGFPLDRNRLARRLRGLDPVYGTVWATEPKWFGLSTRVSSRRLTCDATVTVHIGVDLNVPASIVPEVTIVHEMRHALDYLAGRSDPNHATLLDEVRAYAAGAIAYEQMYGHMEGYFIRYSPVDALSANAGNFSVPLTFEGLFPDGNREWVTEP